MNAIPQAKHKGGMTVRYIDSNDKYVQYRLMSDDWSTTESDWQNFKPIQQKGQSTTASMSQKAVTDELNVLDAEINKLYDHEVSYDTLNNAYILDGVVTSNTSQSTFYKLFVRGTKICIKVNVSASSTLRWGIFSQVPAINLQAIEYGSVGVGSYYEFNYILSQDAYFACSLVT